jgi:hypothetical protein
MAIPVVLHHPCILFATCFYTMHVHCLRQARELISENPDELGDDPLTTATATIRISVNDVNDNSPVFIPSEYTVDIYEDIASNASLPMIMTVNDRDLVRLYIDRDLVRLFIDQQRLLTHDHDGQRPRPGTSIYRPATPPYP